MIQNARLLSLSLALAVLAGFVSGGCKKDLNHSRGFKEPRLSGEVKIAPRENATATTLDSGAVAVIGGFGEEGAVLTDVTIVQTNNKAVPAPSLGQGRARHSAAAIDGGSRVALAGGVGGSKSSPAALASTLIYDPAGSTPGPDLPFPLSEMRAVPFEGSIFLIGGRDAAGAPSGAVLRWTLEPAPGSVAQTATLAAPRAGHTATLALDPAGESRIYVVGGDSGAGPISTVEVIDPATGGLVGDPAPPSLPSPRGRHAATAVGGGAAVLIAGGLGADGLALGDALLLRTSASPQVFDEAGRFGPAVFDLLALPLGADEVVVLGGFTALEGGAPVRPVKEAALFTFDPASGGGEFIDLPDFDGTGAGAPAGAVRPGSGLGPGEGTGNSVVLAGGLDGSLKPRRARSFNPFNAAAARENDIFLRVGTERAIVGAALVGIFGVIERTREYYGVRHRDIDLALVEDPVRGTVAKGKIGEWDIDLEIDGGMIHGEAAEKGFVVFTKGDDLRADRVDVDLISHPDTSVDGRYYLSWKKNSILVELWKLSADRPFEGRVASPDPNVVIRLEANGTHTDSGHSFFDNRSLDLDHSR